jgi:hypothetical protein
MKHQKSFPAGIRRSALVIAALALGAASLPVVAAEDWDIVGIKLGMTEAEVRQKLKEYAPKANVQVFNSGYSYSDGVNSFQTPPFMNALQAKPGDVSKGAENGVKVWMSGPVGEARVIAIARKFQDFSTTAPGKAQLAQSLEQKYGKPAGLAAGDGEPIWEQAGKPTCMRANNGNGLRLHVGPFGSMAQNLSDTQNIESQLEKMRSKSPGMPADLSTCGAIVFYNYLGDPVATFHAGIIDVGAMVATERARNKWVDELEAEAVRKRQGQSQTPRL